MKVIQLQEILEEICSHKITRNRKTDESYYNRKKVTETDSYHKELEILSRRFEHGINYHIYNNPNVSGLIIKFQEYLQKQSAKLGQITENLYVSSLLDKKKDKTNTIGYKSDNLIYHITTYQKDAVTGLLEYLNRRSEFLAFDIETRESTKEVTNEDVKDELTPKPVTEKKKAIINLSKKDIARVFFMLEKAGYINFQDTSYSNAVRNKFIEDNFYYTEQRNPDKGKVQTIININEVFPDFNQSSNKEKKANNKAKKRLLDGIEKDIITSIFDELDHLKEYE